MNCFHYKILSQFSVDINLEGQSDKIRCKLFLHIFESHFKMQIFTYLV